METKVRASKKAEMLDSLLTSRHSCRAFFDTPVNPVVLNEIFMAARHTPSWCNTQPWHVHLVSDEVLNHLKKSFADANDEERSAPEIDFPPSYSGIYLDRRRDAGWALYEAVGVQRGDREGSYREAMKNFEFFGAPHVAVITIPKSLGPYAILDCGLFVQSLLLAAESRGIATIPQAATAGSASILREVLNIAEDQTIVLSVAFGHKDHGHAANNFRTERQPLSSLITRHDNTLLTQGTP